MPGTKQKERWSQMWLLVDIPLATSGYTCVFLSMAAVRGSTGFDVSLVVGVIVLSYVFFIKLMITV